MAVRSRLMGVVAVPLLVGGVAHAYPTATAEAAAVWSAESNVPYEYLGHRVAGAGDVDGDGFDDVILGSLYNAWVYHGSAAGLAPSPSWTTSLVGGWTAMNVASAGDVNGDGYDDVITGDPMATYGIAYDDYFEGAAWVFYGSAAGLSPAPSWQLEGNQAFAGFGGAVAGVGDVNGDGYDDVVVGAAGWTDPEWQEGAAFLYLGSAAGLQSVPAWSVQSDLMYGGAGDQVAGAGDVNGDGYDDVLVSSLGHLATGVFMGSAGGLSAGPAVVLPSAGPIASAGDVNGDGYDDVIQGSSYYSNGESGEGAAVVYLGSAAGLTTPSAWLVESNIEGARFGFSVDSAGDVNADGFDDVVVGATGLSASAGGVAVFLGSAIGLAPSPAAAVVSSQALSSLGWSVCSAGDVDGDGADDVLVGALGYDDPEFDEGAAFLFSW